MNKLSEKLNLKSNFHLSLKSLEFSEKTTLIAFSKFLLENKLTFKIIQEDQDIYNQLFDAFNNKIDYVLYLTPLPVLLPLLHIITNENFDYIKPIIPVYFILKDNRVIQKLKTKCNQTYTTYLSFHSQIELFEQILNYLKNN